MVLAKPGPTRQSFAPNGQSLASADRQFRPSAGRAFAGSRAIDSAMAGRVKADDARAYPRHARSLAARSVRQRVILLATVLGIAAMASVVAVPRIIHRRQDFDEPVLNAAAAARNEAAAWVDKWIAPGAMVACDPLMCAVLLHDGVGAGQVLSVLPGASDPLGASVVVVTPALRSQLGGSRLVSVYAPDVLASFGKGEAQVDIRVIATGGSAADYQHQLKSDWEARQANGRELLQNPEISATAAAARQIVAGNVDSRLLIILPVLVHYCGPVRIVRFGGAGPGRSSGIPLLAAYITPAPPAVGVSLTSAAGEAAMTRAAKEIAAFLKVQWTSIKASFAEHKDASGQVVVQLDVTSPPVFSQFSGNPVQTTPLAPPK
jgi:hypothetical protein